MKNVKFTSDNRFTLQAFLKIHFFINVRQHSSVRPNKSIIIYLFLRLRFDRHQFTSFTLSPGSRNLHLHCNVKFVYAFFFLYEVREMVGKHHFKNWFSLRTPHPKPILKALLWSKLLGGALCNLKYVAYVNIEWLEVQHDVHILHPFSTKFITTIESSTYVVLIHHVSNVSVVMPLNIYDSNISLVI